MKPCLHLSLVLGSSTCMALATTQKGSSSTAKCIAKMKSLADEMASTGKKLDDEELTSYILVDLNVEYNSLVSSIANRVNQLPLVNYILNFLPLRIV
jgi:hypothetical protein